MKSLRNIIVARLQRIAVLMVVLVLPVAVVLQILVMQNQARDSAGAAFHQISQILEENTRELETITEEYRETCLRNAEAIAYMIQYHPEILGDIEEFRRIARMMEVDEIHIFDKTGCIFTGTHPEYFNFTFETGEQIGFFAPMLKDKSLRLCQEVTPNTAEGVLVQYSALWSADGEFIVQVGMYPETIMEYTEKNELSYIFSLLQGSPGVSLYAIDEATGLIQGSTSGVDNGRNMSELGLLLQDVPRYRNGARATVNGVNSYCVFADMGDMLLGYVVSTDSLYRSMPMYTLLLAVSQGLIVVLMVILMWRFTRDYIIHSIQRINSALTAVIQGNLDERVEVRSSVEFSELSDHINDMVRSILATTDKMSFVLDHTNMRVGVYEYSTRMKTVRFTERVPEILKWSHRTRSEIAANQQLLRQFFEKLRQSQVPGESNVFQLPGRPVTYIRLEEVVNGTDTLGILIDVTEEILTRRRIEQERDIDLLTGLYNRRAMERELKAVLGKEPGCGALLMIDADDLKSINDIYGHTVGDWYLKRVAEAISHIGSRRRLAARQGGDEFVLLLYGYLDAESMGRDLDEIRYAQENTWLQMENGQRIQVRFSFGYSVIQGRTDLDALLAEADEQMYEAKRRRKQENG